MDIDGTENEVARRILIALTDIEDFYNTFPVTTDSEFEAESNGKMKRPTSTKTSSVVRVNDCTNGSLHNRDQVSNRPTAIHFYSKPSISFSNFEYLILSFSGSKSDNIGTGLARFEAIMDAFNFSNAEKFIFLAGALKGLTLLFIQSEANITSYASLKQVCIFPVPSQLHQILANRNWRYNEGLMEYFLSTREIAKRGKIDDISLIHYIIQ